MRHGFSASSRTGSLSDTVMRDPKCKFGASGTARKTTQPSGHHTTCRWISSKNKDRYQYECKDKDKCKYKDKEVEESFDGGVCLQTSFELAVALSGPRGACRIFRVESTPLDGTTRRVDGVCAEVRGKINNDII